MRLKRNSWPSLRFALLWVGLVLTALPVLAGTHRETNRIQTVPARAVQYQPSLSGYGRVATAVPIWLRAGAAARVVRVKVVLGEKIRPGQVLLTLGGPLLTPQLIEARAATQAAEKKLRLVRYAATAARRLYPAFTAQVTLNRRQAEVLQMATKLAAARARLDRLRGVTTVRAQISGQVSAVAVSVGTDLQAGARLLRIVPNQDVLLRAEVFPLGWMPSIGVTGRFYPLQRQQSIPVRVTAVAAGFDTNGARELWLAPVPGQGSHGLISGESGRVVLRAPSRAAVQVPVEALVLDRAHWWVMVEEHGKLQARSVHLAADGATTGVIVQGLKPGEQVVVRDSYRLFHRDFSQHYMSTD